MPRCGGQLAAGALAAPSLSAASVLLAVLLLGFVLYKRLTDELRVASNNKNDPLSKIDSYLESNRENLAGAVEKIAECARDFDEAFLATSFDSFVRSPGLLRFLAVIGACYCVACWVCQYPSLPSYTLRTLLRL